MNARLIALLTLGRNNYQYPWARLINIAGAGSIAIGAPGVSWHAQVQPHVVTDLALDDYHRALLHSPGSGNQYLGCASTLYWGHLTRNEPFARNKAVSFCAAIAASQINTTVAMVIADCGSGRWGQALGRFHGVSELQRLSFASKVVAFIDPQNAGVYDNRINRFLAESELDRVLFSPSKALARNAQGQMANPNVHVSTNQAIYEMWCVRLRQARDALNASSPAATWTCTEATGQLWRAVDVERAIFALAQRRRSASGSNLAITKINVDEFVHLLKEFFR